MSQYKDRAEVEYAFSEALRQVRAEARWSFLSFGKHKWVGDIITLLGTILLFYCVKSNVMEALEKGDMKQAFESLLGALLVVVFAIFLGMQRRSRQIRAIYELVEQLKVDRQ
jgi:hypothetical protein